MSDQSQGEGWWLASDGKWYPPESAATPPPAAPPPVTPPPAAAPPPMGPQGAPPPMGQQGAPPPMGPPPSGPPQFGAAGPPPMAAPPPMGGTVASAGMNGCLKAALIVGAILAVLMTLFFVAIFAFADNAVDKAEDAVNDFEKQQAEALNEVEITGCEASATGTMAATVRVKNDSDERSDYVISVAFTSKGGDEQLATGSTSVSGLDSGQSANEEVDSFVQETESFDCEVSDVFRTSS